MKFIILMQRSKQISFLCLILFGLLTSGSLALDVNGWKTRTIYQIITDRFWRPNGDTQSGCDLRKYCGGTFDGITQQLQYVKDLGFDAIWISPVMENLGEDYHGYCNLNWENVNPRFGGEAALKKMVNTAHQMGILVMADVVANHAAPVDTDYSKIYPLNQEYHYHKKCDINDWNNQWEVENCRLCNLPDLDQHNPWVRQYLKDWVKYHIDAYKFDGIRIDTVPHVEKPFWTEYTRSAGVFSIGEILNGNDAYVGDYQNYMDSTLNYGMHFTLKDVFGWNQSMRRISDRWASVNRSFRDPDALGLFVDNHDNPRFLSYQKDWRLFKSATAFSLTARGIPIFYYGGEQGYNGGADPENREPLWRSLNRNHELFKFVQTINKARAAQNVPSSSFSEKYVTDQLYAYTRGRFFVGLTNQLSGTVAQDVPNTGFSNGQVVCNIFKPQDCVTIRNGNLQLYLVDGEVKIYIPKESSFFQSSLQSPFTQITA